MLVVAPWKKVVELTVETNEGLVQLISAPRAGTVVGFLLTQVSGSLDGFTANLYDRSPEDVDPDLLEHYRIFPEKTANNDVAKLIDVTSHWHYATAGGATERKQELFLEITFDGGSVSDSEKRFVLSLLILPASNC